MTAFSTTDEALAQRYRPRIFFDRAETIPLCAIGYTVFRDSAPSASFHRKIDVLPGELVIEYACYWDFDIQHLYDLEHIWVTVDAQSRVRYAEGSFHGKVLVLYAPDLPYAHPVQDDRITAFCQPGKHAFLADGELCRLYPAWQRCCMEESGGPVLIGDPVRGLVEAHPDDDENTTRFLRETLSFMPTLDFVESATPCELLPWETLRRAIPLRMEAWMERLRGFCIL